MAAGLLELCGHEVVTVGTGREALAAWNALLGRVGGEPDPDFVDWLAIERVEGREYDVGLHRHWLDPTRPLAKAVIEPAHGVLVTSATLRGGEGEPLISLRQVGFGPEAPSEQDAHVELAVLESRLGGLAVPAGGTGPGR